MSPTEGANGFCGSNNALEYVEVRQARFDQIRVCEVSIMATMAHVALIVVLAVAGSAVVATGQEPGYPFTVRSDYKLNEDETTRVHKGVDVSSRPGEGLPPRPLDFKAGVYGVVVMAGGGNWGTIGVQLHDGSIVQYLHTSLSHVECG